MYPKMESKFKGQVEFWMMFGVQSVSFSVLGCHMFDHQEKIWIGLIFILGGLATLLWAFSYEFDEPWKKYQVIPPSIIAIAFGLYIAIVGI